MRTRYSEDQQAIDDAFASFFENEATSARVRASAALGHDPELWEKLCATGAPGMSLPSSVGGGDGDLRDLAVVIRRHGRHLAPSPLVEHAVAARLLSTVGAHESASALAHGREIGTITLRPVHEGRARLVPAGAVATVAVGLDGERLVAAVDDPPWKARPNTADLPLADRSFDRAEPVLAGGDAVAGWDRALAEWKALTAVACTGLAARAIEMTVDYVLERHQFGVPVGSFQAVQHGLADAATATAGATILANRAVWALDTGQPDAERLASMALLFAAETARQATDRGLQYHGGYGFAEEYDIQLYHRRAVGWILQLGDPSVEYAWLAGRELDDAARNGVG